MISKRQTRLGFLLLFFLLLLCPPRARSYEAIEVKNGGIIKGVVKFDGQPPKRAPLNVSKFKEVCKNVPDESLVVGTGGGVRYAVITLEGVTRGKAVEKEAQRELDNVRCRFVPHVQAASVGQFLVLKNTDPILHTAHAYFHDGQPQFNVGLFPGRVSRKPLVTPGLVKILCEVHPWMSAYLVITEHPYHAVTDLFGEYDIRDVPPGVYRLKVWHETLGSQEKKIEVKAGAVSKADFVFSLPRGKKR